MLRLIQRFCAALRQEGLNAGPGDAASGVQALLCIDFLDREQARLALRAVFCRKVADYAPFERAFQSVWDGRPLVEITNRDGDGDGDGDGLAEAGGGAEVSGVAAEASAGALADASAVSERSLPAYSAAAILSRDIGELAPEELPGLERLARQMARQLAMQLSQRLKRSKRGAVDPSRTLRRALRTGGEIIQFRRRRSRREKARIVSLLDVSGSMQPYARVFLQFLSVLQRCVPYMETFLFSTDLTRVTRNLRSRDLMAVAQSTSDWAGGTRIGASLDLFVRDYAPRLAGANTVMLVLSDGLDVGDLDLLAGAIRRLKAATGHLIWLNPLAGGAGYEPLARGMRTILPYLDLLAPAHSLQSLLHVGSIIGGIRHGSRAGHRAAGQAAIHR